MDESSLQAYLSNLMEALRGLTPEAALLCGLLMLSGFFSCSETAMFTLSRSQIRRRRDSKSLISRRIVMFVDNPRNLLNTSLIGNAFVNAAIATVVASSWQQIVDEVFKWSDQYAASAAVVSATLLTLFFGEIGPKTFAIRHADRVSAIIALPLWLCSHLLTPLRLSMRWAIDMVVRVFRLRNPSAEPAVTEEEIRGAADAGAETGQIETDERRLIDRVFELRNTQAKDILVPRTEMVCVEKGQTLRAALETARSVGHSRLPVYEETPDKIVGVLHVKDLPIHFPGQPDLDATIEKLMERMSNRPEGEETLIRPPLKAPESKPLHALLNDFSDAGTQMAILLDEYAGVAGLATLEDIIEEIVGEIVDEYDDGDELEEEAEEYDLTLLDRGGIPLPAKTSLRVASKLLGASFNDEDAVTLGGYMFNLFGQAPSTGDSVTDELGYTFTVTEMNGERILTALVTRRPDETDEEGANA